jgi:glycosyltransferase involved in cell wall biosynthesis
MIPAVSVIIPTHDRRDLVSAAIASVLAQRDVEFELIVVDDGSRDGTWNVLESIAAENATNCPRATVRIVRTGNRGVAAARNTGAALAAAPILTFLDSDDLWGPHKLARQLDFMRANPRYAIAQTGELWLRHGVRVNPARRHRKRAGDIFIDSLRTCLISPSAVIMRTALFRELGGFDEDMLAAEDYDLWLRILLQHETGLLDEPHVTRRAAHPGQLSATVAAIDRFRILALLKLIARDHLTAARRAAVCEVLAGKCEIYAKGLLRRGRQDAAGAVLGLAASARGIWRETADDAAIASVTAMRDLLRRRTAVEAPAEIGAGASR